MKMDCSDMYYSKNQSIPATTNQNHFNELPCPPSFLNRNNDHIIRKKEEPGLDLCSSILG